MAQASAPPAQELSRGRGFPWAGVLAVVLVLALDAWLGSPGGPWSAAAERLPGGTRDILGGLASSRVEWRQLAREASDTRPRVVLVGSSRGEAAWRDGAPPLAELRPDVAWVHDAHPGIEPFQMRSRVGPLVDAAPDVVVLLLSAFDTHRSVQLVPRANGQDTGAVLELVGALGPAVSWRERASLLRFGLASVLDSYRLRAVLRRAFGEQLTRFDLGRPGRSRAEASWPVAVPRGEGRPMSASQYQRIREALATGIPRLAESESFLQKQLGVLQAITLGEHATVHLGFVRSTVERLAAAGCSVVLLEGPLCPLPVSPFSGLPGDEFDALARELALDPLVSWVPVSASGPFVAGDFRDLVHVNAAGADKLSAATARAVDAALASRAGGG